MILEASAHLSSAGFYKLIVLLKIRICQGTDVKFFGIVAGSKLHDVVHDVV